MKLVSLAYYSLNELPSLTRNLLSWVRRRLRSLLWKKWKKGQTRHENGEDVAEDAFLADPVST
ncbi:group II intron maturase-specific domain-containing protein [Trabulsiella odontotermitis]|uniref:group II intron maturase-specific domain-containing protein n=1 Tax=Trabulsiella odontotermitis TaxID=379893 RepID=UPI0009BBAB29